MKSHQGGQITVFLSLIIVCICALMASLLESARIAGARNYLKMASDSALDSVMSQYHRELWEKYHLLLLEEEEDGLREGYCRYLGEYLNTEDFYSMGLEDGRVEGLIKAADMDGIPVEKEILAYMKYGVWNMEEGQEDVEELVRSLAEAANVKTVVGLYGGHSREALRLERALEQIEDSLKTQQQYYSKAVSCLHDYDGPEFCKAAQELIRELKKIPGLVQAYEKKADALERELINSRAEYEAGREYLSENTMQALAAEIENYDSYIKADGERRKEIAALTEMARNNIDTVEAAIIRAKEVEEIIDSWDEEDDDHLDEGALWNSVLKELQSFSPSRLSCTHGIQDKEKRDALNRLADMVRFSFLELVLPKDREVSKTVLDTTDFPSLTISDGWNMSSYPEAFPPSPDGAEEEIGSLAAGVITNEYAGRHFDNFLTQSPKEVQYELEYILDGQGSDEGNLQGAIEKLLLAREGMNFLHILADSQKRQEAEAMAQAIVGAAGLVPLTAITAFFIMGVWALAEAILDVRSLLRGDKVPLIKTADTWKLGLNELLSLDGIDRLSGEEAGGGNKTGFCYETYLKLFLLFMPPRQKYYRYMDVMQMNIRREQSGFLIAHCVYQAQMSCTVNGRIHMSSGSLKAY